MIRQPSHRLLLALVAGAAAMWFAWPARADAPKTREQTLRDYRAMMRGEGAIARALAPAASGPGGEYTGTEGKRFVQSVDLINALVRYRLTYDVVDLKEKPGEVTSHLWAWTEKYVTLGMVAPSSANWYTQGFLQWSLDGESLHTRRAQMRVARDAGPDVMVEYSWDCPKAKVILRFALSAGGDMLLMYGRYEPKEKVARSTVRLMAYPGTYDRPYKRMVTTAERAAKPGEALTLDAAKERWVLLEDVTEGRPASGSAGLVVGTPGSFASIRARNDAYATFAEMEMLPEKHDFLLALYDFPRLPDWEETRRYFRAEADSEAALLERLAPGRLDAPLPADASRGRKSRADYSPVVERRPAPVEGEMAPAAPAKPVTLFTRDYTEPVYPTSIPRPGEVTETFRMSACRGEYEPVTLCLHARDTDVAAQLELAGDFTGPGGARISRRHVDARVVRCSGDWRTAADTRRVPLFLDSLRPEPSNVAILFEPVRVPKGESARFWLTVRVPGDAMPGRYTMPLKVHLDAGEALPARVELEMLPFALLKPEVAFGMYYAIWPLPRSKWSRGYQRLVFRDMAAHGMNTLAQMYLIPVQGSMDVANAPSLGVAPLMEDLAAAGLCAKAPIIVCTTQDAETRRRMIALNRERRWPGWAFYAIDEPGWGGKATVEACRKLCENWKQKIPGIRQATAMYHKTDVSEGDLGKALDIWIYHVTTLDNGLIALNRKLGKELWSYDCVFGPMNPEASRLHYGLYTWALGLKGAMKWVYQDCAMHATTRMGHSLDALVPKHNTDANPWVPDLSPWDLYDPENREEYTWGLGFTYPGSVGPEPTVGWELVREGVDDYRYLITLEAALRQARKAHPKSPAITRAEALLARLRGRIKPGATFTGPPAMPEHEVASGIALGEYARMRAEVVSALRALGAGPGH